MHLLGRRSLRVSSLVTSLVTAGAALMASGAAAAQPAQTFGYTLRGPAQAKPARQVPSRKVGVDTSRAPQLALSALDNRALAAAEKSTVEGGDDQHKVLHYAAPRGLDLSAADGAWTVLPDSRRLWVAEVVSPNALGLRLHLDALALPPGAELAIYAPTAEPQDAAARAEVRQGSPASRQRTALWTGTFPGERVRVEYLAPRGASGDELPFRVDRLLHVYRDLVREAWQDKRAGACNNDVSCYGELAEVERSVVLVLMPDGACSGTLIDNLSHDGTPLVLTANHCVYKNAIAADTELVWFYKSAACNGEPPPFTSLPRSLGTTLVSTSRVSDYSLLQVKGALPPNATFAGWTSDPPEAGTESLTIHHPDADFKRVSFGVVNADALQCTRGFRGTKMVRIDWTDGPTEPGSSGAGIFRADTLQLFGQLTGGPSACGRETYDCFGSFAVTYPRIEQFLGGGDDDPSENNDDCKHARLVTPGTTDGLVARANDDDWYRIRVPKGSRVTVHLDFVNADGDLDLTGTTSCASGNVVTASLSTNDTEEITLEGGRQRFTTVRWRVSLQGDTRNEYSMRVTVD